MYISKQLIFLPIAFYFFSTPLLADEGHVNPPKNNTQYAIPPGEIGPEEKALPFTLGASYTLWVPYLTGANTTYSNGSTTNFGKVIRPNIFPVSGFKVHLGIYTYHDDWKFSANYTWFYFEPGYKNAYLQNNGQVIYGSPFSDEPSTGYSSANSQFKTQFNRLDGFLYKRFHTGKYMTFAPRIGLLGAWDLMRLNFNNVLIGLNDTEQGRMTQYWWGIGPYGGAMAALNLCKNFSLYLNSGLAMLYTQHYVKNKNFTRDSDGTLLVAINNSETNFYNVEPLVECKLGLSWDKDWEKVGLCLDVAWELQMYFMHNGFTKYYSPTGVGGDYAMQGLTAGIGISF